MTTTLRDHYLAEYTRQADQLPGQADAWLRGEREAALQRFAENGLPTPRDEQWKYTDLRLLEKRLLRAATPTGTTLSVEKLPMPAGLDSHRLVFLNGLFSPALSDIGSLPTGGCVSPLSQQLLKPGESVRAQLNATLNGHSGPLSDFNLAFMRDGLYLHLADGVALERPVYVLYLSTGPGLASLRSLVHLGMNSHATLIEHHVGLRSPDAAVEATLTHSLTEVQLGTNAGFTRCKLQQDALDSFHLGAFYMDQGRDSRAWLHGIDLGGRLVRNDTHTRLVGTGAEIYLDGVYAPSGRQHIDNHTQIDHLKPHGTSREAYKGVLDGHGRGVFNGKIVVHKDAQKTDSDQSSAALLLSKTAEVDAKPELEIYADDVKCAHGATVGQLDESAVFYLRSRGVEESNARNILTYSFADEIIRRVGSAELRRHIESHFMAKLPNSQQLKELL